MKRFLVLPFILGAALLVGACEAEEAEVETEAGVEEPLEDEEAEVEVEGE